MPPLCPPGQVQFSPFEEGKLALATGQHFGIVGNGRLFVLQLSPGGIGPIAMYANPRRAEATTPS